MLKTFVMGGVHPPDNKLSIGAKLEFVQPDGISIIPLSQHIGAPATPTVAVGDKVKAGQLIAQSAGFVSANIHSGVSGTVTAIDSVVCDASGIKKPGISIQVEGDDWDESVDRSTTINRSITASGGDIVKKIQAMGIVGMGGATFPTHVKLTIPEGKKAEVLIINAVECEPYLTADHRLMLEKGDEILVGVEALKRAIGVKQAYIGIENNKKDAIAHLTSLSQNFEGITVVPLKVKYPQGGEKQLIKAIINKEVPSMGLPIETGAVVQNVATAFAVYEAVQKNKPLVERVVTVTGKKLSSTKNFIARIGTPVNKLIDLTGGVPENTGKIVLGGPMMGKATATVNVPVTKGTSGVLLFDESESHRRPEHTCIRCAKCVEVCPMGLEPYLLTRQAKNSLWDALEENKIQDCIECGCCLYTCPANVPLLDWIRFGKAEVMKRMRARNGK
ncbi:MAG: electron transport complex subunit RsxC [Prevotellaceae bacterium]|nr:electron transport complex subunit RsxC [Prevotellaceae bacterium]